MGEHVGKFYSEAIEHTGLSLQGIVKRFVHDPAWREAAHREGINDQTLWQAAAAVNLIPLSFETLVRVGLWGEATSLGEVLATTLPAPAFEENTDAVDKLLMAIKEALPDIGEPETWVIAQLILDGWTRREEWEEQGLTTKQINTGRCGLARLLKGE